jgi:chemotaxis protein methyltransferase CheR
VDQDSGVAQLEASLFAEALYRRYGVDYRGYAAAGLARKLDSLRGMAGLDSISALQGKVLHELDFARRAMRVLSASGSSALTSAACFMPMRCAALPVLRSASWPVLWLAECSDPALVMQLVVMLEEEGLLGKTQIFVTSANEELLAEVEQLALPKASIAALEALHMQGGARRALADYCEPDGEQLRLRAPLRHNIVWGQYDLASDASFNEFHLILCQRSFRDFDLQLQRRALGLFSQSLCNFGILQLEPPSELPGSGFGRDFACLLPEQGLYRRLP